MDEPTFTLTGDFSIKVEKFKCDNGHETTGCMNVYVDSFPVARFCGVCFGEWAQKQWPVTKV